MSKELILIAKSGYVRSINKFLKIAKTVFIEIELSSLNKGSFLKYIAFLPYL